MSKITCYTGCIKENTLYLYNPESKQVVTRNTKGEIVRVHNLESYQERSLEQLDKLYSISGNTIEIEEGDFNELCKKAKELKFLHDKTNSLAKKLFPYIK